MTRASATSREIFKYSNATLMNQGQFPNAVHFLLIRSKARNERHKLEKWWHEKCDQVFLLFGASLCGVRCNLLVSSREKLNLISLRSLPSFFLPKNTLINQHFDFVSSTQFSKNLVFQVYLIRQGLWRQTQSSSFVFITETYSPRSVLRVRRRPEASPTGLG